METRSLTERLVSLDCVSLVSSVSTEIPVHFKKETCNMRRLLSWSCESLVSGWSIDDPMNFHREAHNNRSSQMNRPASPSYVSLASGWSIDDRINFKRDRHNSRRSYSSQMNRPASPSSVSLTSGWSTDDPVDFKQERHNKRRSLRPPSPTASYMSMGTAPSSQGYFPPIQNRTEESRPSPRYAGHRDVSCDLCEDKKLKASKSCLTCMASFCETHVRDHYIIEPLQRHLLVEVTKNLSILQENADMKKKTMMLEMEIAELKKDLHSINQIKLRIPDFICTGKRPKAADVMLDPATAHRALIISEDRRRVRLGNKKTLSQSGQRFKGWECVVATEGFSSGRHFWHMEVNKEFTVGVVKQSAPRKERFQFTPRNGYWCLYHYWMSFTALDSPVVRLSTDKLPRVLGVCVDVDERWVIFYNAETKTLLYMFKLMIFQPGEKIYPVFSTSEKSMDLEIMT